MKSYHPKSLLNDLQYYITPPHDCSYLESKSARMVFLDPVHRIDGSLDLYLNFRELVFGVVAILFIAPNAICVGSVCRVVPIVRI